MNKVNRIFLMMLAACIISMLITGLLFAQGKAANRVKAPVTNRTVLKNGLQIITVEHHELPVVAINLMIKSGSFYNPDGKAGIADITAEMLKLGTKTKKSIDIANAFDSLGAQLNINSDWDATYINTQALTGDFDKVMTLLADIVLNPTFPEDEFKLVKERRLAGLKRSLDDPGYLAGKRFNEALFKGHPYAYSTDGTPETIDAIGLDDVKKFCSTFFIPNNSIVCIVGDIDPKNAVKLVEANFQSWKKGKIVEPKIAPTSKPQGINVHIMNKGDLTQSQIRIGHLAAPRNTPDYYAIQVMNYIYGGGSFSSRLMKIIRSQRGYTYGIRSSYDWRMNTGPFSISSFTVNKQVKNLITETLAIGDDIIRNGVTDDELNAAKSFYVGNYALQFETPSQIANQVLNIELYNLGKDYIDNYQDNIEKVTHDDIKRVASQYLDTKNLVISVASNAADIRADMEQLGKVEIVDIK